MSEPMGRFLTTASEATGIQTITNQMTRWIRFRQISESTNPWMMNGTLRDVRDSVGCCFAVRQFWVEEAQRKRFRPCA